MRSFATFIAFAAVSFAPLAAGAAPFCLTSQTIPPQCIYYDAALCGRDASRQGGICSANPSEMRLVAGVGQYCMVTSGGAAVCQYSDVDTCFKDATRQGGTCMAAPQPGSALSAPNPYSPIEGR